MNDTETLGPRNMRVIIAGGRDFADYDLLYRKMVSILKDQLPVNVEIVSGGANGADKLGERWAESLAFPVKRFPADWNKHGKSAGPIRNEEMAKYATHCVVFWDGKSRGSKNMIDTAAKYKLPTRVIYYHV